MAAIRETLILEDKFTSTMTQCLQVAQRMANMLDDVRASTMNVETAAAATAVQMQELAGKMTQTNSRGTSLLGTIRNLAGTFLGMQSVRWLVNTSDQLTSINARLRLMTGSAEAAAAAQEEIYQAAMRSRGAYADMADFVSQLGTVPPMPNHRQMNSAGKRYGLSYVKTFCAEMRSPCSRQTVPPLFLQSGALLPEIR